MRSEQRRGFAEQVAHLDEYRQAPNQCESLDEVVSLSLAAIALLPETSEVTVGEVRDDSRRVRGSTAVDLGESPGAADLRVTLQRD